MEEIKENCNCKKDFIDETKLLSIWNWLQKYALLAIIFISIGFSIGIYSSKALFKVEVVKAINLQRFEYNGDIFDIQLSSIQKYYNKDRLSGTNK